MSNIFKTIGAIVCLLGLNTHSSCAFANDAAQSYNWTDVTGKFSIDAALLRLEDDQVELIRKEGGAPLKLPLARLSKESQLQAKMIWFNRQDHRQFAMVRDHFGSLSSRPAAVSELLIEVHNAIPESPYAGIWAAVGLSAGQNKFDQARVILDDVVRRISQQREVDAKRHAMTLCSAYNNLAVCYVKDHNGDRAAAKLAEAMQTSRLVPVTVRHNAELATEIGGAQYGALKVGDRARRSLMRTLATSQVSGIQSNLEDGWYYSLDFDLLNKTIAGSQRVDGLEPPRGDVELQAIGTGFVVAPGAVLTSRLVVETTDIPGPKLVTIGVGSVSEFNSLSVGQLYLSSSRRIADSSTSYGAGSLQSPAANAIGWTTYRYLHPASGSTDAELAVLSVPGMNLRPIPLAEKSPAQRTPVSLLGYRRGPEIVKRGVLKLDGSVISEPDYTKQQTCTCIVRGGNRGGPLLNSNDEVVGVAFDSHTESNSPAGKFFGALAIRDWLYRHVQTLSPATRGDEGLSANVEMSVVPVFTWGLRQQSQSQLFSQVADASKAGAGMNLRDDWCVGCQGRGFADCVNRQCHQGGVMEKRRVQVGVNFKGEPVYGMKSFRTRCNECQGTGGEKCPFCDEGKLKVTSF